MNIYFICALALLILSTSCKTERSIDSPISYKVNASTSKLLAPSSKLFRNNMYGYVLAFPSGWKSPSAVGSYASPVNEPYVEVGELMIFQFKPEKIFPSENANNFEVYVQEFWNHDRDFRCGSGEKLELSALQKRPIRNAKAFEYSAIRSCSSIPPEGEKPSPHTSVLAYAYGQHYLISYETEIKTVMERVIDSIEFFPPCGGEKQPHCPSALPPSGIYKLSSTGALIPIEWNQQ